MHKDYGIIKMMHTRDDLLRRVIRFYLESHDFNGQPAAKEIPELVTDLVSSRKLSVIFGDRHPNPHIKAFEPESIEEQIQKIRKVGLEGACLYPTEEHLRIVVDSKKYDSRPFTLKLALGEPQLKPYFFDLAVLEIYRNDPRYRFDVDDIHGTIGVTSKHSEARTIRESDEVFMQTFGFAYDLQMNRAVAVYLRYLHDLSPEHQRIWEAKILTGDYKLHPDYYRSTMGQSPERESVFSAFLEEIRQINKMCKLMGRPSLFRKEFEEGKKPREFGFLLRPTSRELNNFIQLLDKLMSENINLAFFGGEVPLEYETVRRDGKVAVKNKGSINILREWIDTTIRFPDPKPKEDMVEVFRKIRKLRQNPAHAIQEDLFDQKYFNEQRKLIMEMYGAIRTLRLILANHPAVKDYKVPEWLHEGKIWTF